MTDLFLAKLVCICLFECTAEQIVSENWRKHADRRAVYPYPYKAGSSEQQRLLLRSNRRMLCSVKHVISYSSDFT
jgi:hypothetical protein